MSARQVPGARARRTSKVQLLAAALVLVAGVSGGLAWSLTGSGTDHPAPVASPDPTPTGTPGDEYTAGILKDFGALSTVLINYLQTLQSWREDKVDDAAVTAATRNVLDDIAGTQQALAARPPFYPAPRAQRDYRAAADLYGQAALLTQATTAVPHGPLRTQLQLATSRIQTLADRVFDQGAAELKPYVTPDREFDSVQIMRADEIPGFGSSRTAAGAPLTDVGGAPTPHPYQTSRPEEPRSEWLKAVEKAHIPTQAQTAGAIDAGRTAELAADSVGFTRAAELLHEVPDPQGERIVSTRIQLALLVAAEAGQLGLAATLVPPAQQETFRHIAQALSLICDRMWDDRLGERESTYPDSLLILKHS